MPLESVFTESAPAPIGPYSQAVSSGGLLFCSGQVALDPATGELAAGDVSTQAEQVMRNLRSVLNAGGCDFGNVVKTTIFLVDMNDFAAVNAVYGTYFDATKPARSTVAVAGLPRGARVEIEAVAVTAVGS
jgi:2-iminobutanoate/2-iminopropanoate deaminase